MSREIDLTQIPGQEDFVFDDRPECAWFGGRGCSKTASGTFKMMRYLEENEGARGVVIAPTYPQLRSGTMETIYEWLPREWILQRWDSPDTLRCDILLPGWENPGRIYFRNAYNPDRYRSLEVAFRWLDEVSDCRRETLQVSTPCLRQKRPDGGHYPYQTWVTGTPRGQNWAYQRFVQHPDPAITGTYFGSPFNNPYLPQDYTRELEREYPPGTPLHDQEVMGKFISMEGLVYPLFDPDIHVKLPPDTNFKRVGGGADFGLSEASCGLLVGETAAGRRWAFREFYQKRASLGEVLGTMTRWRHEFHVERYFGDPRAPDELSTLNAAGIPISKANANMETGVRAINQLLAVDDTGEPGLYISPECPNLIREMLTYCHTSSGYGDGQSFYDSIKTRQSDHAVDTLRYVILGMMGRQAKCNIGALRF
jgi:hypothetical protein